MRVSFCIRRFAFSECRKDFVSLSVLDHILNFLNIVYVEVLFSYFGRHTPPL
jgi:hypothetical protein